MEKRDYNNMPEAEETAIWFKKSQGGKEYLSGIVKVEGKEYKIVAFLNDKEGNEKRPDYSFKRKDQIQII